METRFIVDCNVGKLARLLRMTGYDALFFHNINDDELINIALKEKRIVLTRDAQIMKRRVATNGQLKIVFIEDDEPKKQLRQVIKSLKLDCCQRQFTRCLECNEKLLPKTKEEVKEIVPPYVFLTQTQYMQCPSCQRVYWRGTHWVRMKEGLDIIINEKQTANIFI